MKKILLGLIGLLFAVPAVATDLPAGYTELGYIHDTSETYIDTGITLYADKDDVELTFAVDDATTNQSIFGARGSTTSRVYTFATNADKWRVGFGNVSTVTEITADTARHTVRFYHDTGIVSLDNTNIQTMDTSSIITPTTATIGAIHATSSTTLYQAAMKIYRLKIWRNGTLIADFVPAQYGNTVGMYDTVSGTFFTNAGSGTFTGGPVVVDSCRNLFDPDSSWNINASAQPANNAFPNTFGGERGTYFFECKPNTSYTISASSMGDRFTVFGYNTNVNPLSATTNNIIYANDKFISKEVTSGVPASYTFTTGANTQMCAAYYSLNVRPNNLQIEEGDTATEYVPYCANAIKIATTAYNSARFSPVVTELNTTIATIRSVVTNTINQTAAIADLQATKQTRPNENCPAGKKCLLVEDNDGTPHWYEIIENAYGLPSGYTGLEYIESTGTQYIDTGLTRGKFVHDIAFTTVSNNNLMGNAAGAGWYWGQLRNASGNGYELANRTITEMNSTERRVVEYDNLDSARMILSAGGQTVTYSATGGISYNYILFRIYNSDQYHVSAKLWGFQAYDAKGKIVRDMVPAKRNSDNEVGLYDNVNDVFYTNQGTGTFDAGPEI